MKMILTMMLALKVIKMQLIRCDKCGTEFENNWISRRVRLDYDLCPKCTKKLAAWIKRDDD